MSRYTRLRENFFSLRLQTGEMDLKPGHTADCFFIANHPHSKEYISKQALSCLIDSRCRSFHFYGAYCSEWELGFDKTDVMMHPTEDYDDFAVTSCYKTIEEFTDILGIALSTRSIVPCNIYLIYDDEEIYNAVLNKTNRYL